MIRRLLCLCACGAAVLFLSSGCDKGKGDSKAGDGGSKSPGGKQLVIGVIPKSTDNLFWKSVEAGARKAEAETGCQVRWQGPPSESDRQAQRRIIDDMAVGGVDAVCIAPNDANALNDVIGETHKKMPVIVYDSGASTEDYTAFIATDNHKGGELAGKYMLKLLGDNGGNVAIVLGAAGSESTTQREDGFRDAVKKNPKVKIVAEVRGDNDTDKSVRAAADVLAREGHLDGFFGPSQPACSGILRALEDAHQDGKVKFVGFDSGEELAKGMDEKKIDALVVQRPVLMGEMAVKAAVAACKGEKVEKVQRIAPQLITQEDKDKPEMQELLRPKLK